MVSPGELAWHHRLTPITQHFAGRVGAHDFSGRTILACVHIVMDAVSTYLPFRAAGARVVLTACNRLSTDAPVVESLRAGGVEVLAEAGMSEAARLASIQDLAAIPADALCDMGGELIAAYAATGKPALAALEATTSGIAALRHGPALPFPVFNWNDIPLKDALHNRIHVGYEAWPTFGQITGMSLIGRVVAVIGFGPVGRGVAEAARGWRARVIVVERDAVRAVEAASNGFQVADLPQALGLAEIVVTATGRPGIITPTEIALLRDQAILFNVGHFGTEIDVVGLADLPQDEMRRHIRRYRCGDTSFYILNDGNILNLAPGMACFSEDLFDPFAAVIVEGLRAILAGELAGMAPGLHLYPADLSREIAARLSAIS